MKVMIEVPAILALAYAALATGNQVAKAWVSLPPT